jgi:hypothetical protein
MDISITMITRKYYHRKQTGVVSNPDIYLERYQVHISGRRKTNLTIFVVFLSLSMQNTETVP